MSERNAMHILSYILKIDQSIRNGDYPNAKKLNQEYGWNFSRSTFGRYIEMMRSDYGAPIDFDYKKNGYYYTDTTFYLHHVMLKEGELLTLSTILPLLEQYKNTPMEKSFRDLMQKLVQMLPDSITVDSALINDEVHYISEPVTSLEDGVFENVLKATKLHQTLKIEYKAAKDSDYNERLFNPYHMVCHNGTVYLSFETNQLGPATSWIMSFTGGAKVLNPPELKEEVRNAAQKILDSY